MSLTWKERFSALSARTKGVLKTGQGLFDKVAIEDAAKLDKIQRATPNIQLRAVDRDRPVIEALVAVSWRGSIISIPRIIMPNNGREGYTVFALDEKGVPRKPIPAVKPTIIGFMDWVHLEDNKCKHQKSRWAILKAYRNYRTTSWPSSTNPVVMINTPVFELHFIPDSVLSSNDKNIQRSELEKPVIYNSFPAFEVDPLNRYYEDILRRMGAFLGIGHPIPANNLTKFYQFMTMKYGNFISMYSYVPKEDHTQSQEAESAPILTIREQMESQEAKPKPKPKPEVMPSRPLTLHEQLSSALPGVKIEQAKKKIVLTKR